MAEKKVFKCGKKYESQKKGSDKQRNEQPEKEVKKNVNLDDETDGVTVDDIDSEESKKYDNYREVK